MLDTLCILQGDNLDFQKSFKNLEKMSEADDDNEIIEGAIPVLLSTPTQV